MAYSGSDRKIKRVAAERRYNETRIAAMRDRHGPGPEGQACQGCVFLFDTGPYERTHLKCEQYGNERSDWRAKWPSCGLWKASA